MVVLNKKAIAVRDRMYRHMEVMAPELKNGFPARTRWDKKDRAGIDGSTERATYR